MAEVVIAIDGIFAKRGLDSGQKMSRIEFAERIRTSGIVQISGKHDDIRTNGLNDRDEPLESMKGEVRTDMGIAELQDLDAMEAFRK
jgi:hypothetical protein